VTTVTSEIHQWIFNYNSEVRVTREEDRQVVRGNFRDGREDSESSLFFLLQLTEAEEFERPGSLHGCVEKKTRRINPCNSEGTAAELLNRPESVTVLPSQVFLIFL
jgi:hypothetical protein